MSWMCVPALLFVVPISQLSRKNVFLSPRTSDGVSAQQEKTFSLSLICATKRSCCAATCVLEIVARVVAAQNQEMSTFYSWKNNLEWKMLRQSDLTEGVAKSLN